MLFDNIIIHSAGIYGGDVTKGHFYNNNNNNFVTSGLELMTTRMIDLTN